MGSAIRLPVALVFGVAFTAVIFLLLWTAVTGEHDYAQLRQAVKIDFSPLRHDTEVETKRDKVERPKPTKAPEVPTIDSSAGSVGGAAVSMVTPSFEISGVGISVGSDRDVIPLVRINPEYPARARSRGVEGWVQIEFTITPAGTVKDPKVVDAEPKGLFERAALEAISRWKYNPKVEEGRAVERRGVQIVLRFELEK
jgi:periplasmic protein TonB